MLVILELKALLMWKQRFTHFLLVLFVMNCHANRHKTHHQKTIHHKKGSRRDHIDNLVKIAKAESLLEEMDEFLKENSFSQAASGGSATTGNLGINIMGTYLKVKEISDVLEKVRNGEPGATKSLIEAIGTLVLFDIPGAVTPAIETFDGLLMEPGEEATNELQKAVNNVHQKVKWHATSAKATVKGRVKMIGKTLHSMSDYVGDALETLQGGTKERLKVAGRAMNAFAGTSSEKLGAALTKAGGTMNVLSMMYSGYKIGEALADDPPKVDTVVEHGIVLVGAFVSLAATYAAAGSMLGPIGTVAGVVIAGIAAIYGAIKPDPENELKEEMQASDSLSNRSLANLYLDYEKLPDIVPQELAGSNRRFVNDWIFENNQLFMKKSIRGVTPDTPLRFKLTGIQPSEAAESECARGKRFQQNEDDSMEEVQSSKCLRVGTERHVDKSVYEGHFYELKGRQDFKRPFDFYGYYNSTSFKGTIIFVRTNVLQPTDKVRSIEVDTTPPIWGPPGSTKKDDILVLFDMRQLDPSAKIVVNLGGGEDGVALNGMIGNKATSHNDTMDIAFGAVGSNEDFGGMLDLSGMRQNLIVYNEIRLELEGVSYFASYEGGRGKVCYRWKGGLTTCPINVSPVAIYGSSPFNDVIHLNSNNHMLVINDWGDNTYVLEVKSSNSRRSFQIVDKTKRRGAKINIVSDESNDIIVAHSEKDEMYEVYQKTLINNRDSYKLKIIIKYKGSKNIPSVMIKNSEIQQSSMPKSITEKTKKFTEVTMFDETSFTFIANGKPKNDGPKSVCICTPDIDYEEAYWNLRLTSNVDKLIISRQLLESMETLSVKLIYDKISDDNFGWIMKIREKSDLAGRGNKRAELRLDNSIELVVTTDNKVLADLTDPHALVNEINLEERLNAIYSFTEVKQRVTLDGDDIIIFDSNVEGSTFTGTINLGTGLNVLVYDYISQAPNLVFAIQDKVLGQAMDGKSIKTREVKIGTISSVVRIENVDRLLCQFKGGIQRELPDFLSGRLISTRTFLQMCEEIDPFKSGGDYFGKKDLPKTEDYCSRCDSGNRNHWTSGK